MKRKLKKIGVLDLGKELSKSQQKKITGGVLVYCSDSPEPYILGGDCSSQMGYCAGAHHGTFINCTP